MTRRDADVLVVGGGPAGSATAALLAQSGLDVLVLEKHGFPREKACAEYFSPGVVDCLERLGALDQIRRHDVAYPRGMHICTASTRWLLRYDDHNQLGGSAGSRTALSLPRPLFDHLLLEHARSRGARICERTTVLETVIRQGGVAGVRVRQEGRMRELLAPLVVAADGLRSAVSRSLGLDLPTSWPRRLGLVTRYAGATPLGDYGAMFVGPGIYCGVAPAGPDLLSLGLVSRLDDRVPGESIERRFERLLAALPEARVMLASAQGRTPVRGSGPLARRVRRVAGPGYLLVGDAAGFLDPFTGEGVYRALRGAELAAAAIGEAFRSNLKSYDELARMYTQARRQALRDKEYVTRIVQLVLGSRRWFDLALRRLNQRPRPAAILAAVLGDYHPATHVLRPAYVWSLLGP